MRQRHASRLLAGLTALLFFGGDTGVSGLDALLFHRSGAPAHVLASHYDASGAPNDHADHCLLTFRVAGTAGASPSGSSVRFEDVSYSEARHHPTAAPRRFFPGLHQESRAPPSALA